METIATITKVIIRHQTSNNNTLSFHASSSTSFGGGYHRYNLNDDDSSEEDSDHCMNISKGDNGGQGYGAEIAEELEATKKKLEGKEIEMVIMRNGIDHLKEEADQKEDEHF